MRVVRVTFIIVACMAGAVMCGYPPWVLTTATGMAGMTYVEQPLGRAPLWSPPPVLPDGAPVWSFPSATQPVPAILYTVPYVVRVEWGWLVLQLAGFAFLSYAIVYVMLTIEDVARRARRTPGHCVCCGYDLRASPDRCPECGEPSRSDR